MMYAVATRHYGRKLITSGGVNNPMGGLLDYPKSVWTQITKRPIGLERAIDLANAQDTYATVQPWGAGETTYYNGKPPLIPSGWYPPQAQTAQSIEMNLVCLRCGHSWLRRTLDRPASCPKCKSRIWDKPREEKAPPKA